MSLRGSLPRQRICGEDLCGQYSPIWGELFEHRLYLGAARIEEGEKLLGELASIITSPWTYTLPDSRVIHCIGKGLGAI